MTSRRKFLKLLAAVAATPMLPTPAAPVAPHESAFEGLDPHAKACYDYAINRRYAYGQYQFQVIQVTSQKEWGWDFPRAHA